MKRLAHGMTVAVVIASAAVLFSLIPSVIGADADEWREQCEIECNEIFGGIGRLRPPATGAAARHWAHCMLECERKYWKKWDREIERETQ